eukprot:TCONS_00013090-protein
MFAAAAFDAFRDQVDKLIHTNKMADIPNAEILKTIQELQKEAAKFKEAYQDELKEKEAMAQRLAELESSNEKKITKIKLLGEKQKKLLSLVETLRSNNTRPSCQIVTSQRRTARTTAIDDMKEILKQTIIDTDPQQFPTPALAPAPAVNFKSSAVRRQTNAW